MKIVMCRPDFFDVTYTLSNNRWMNLEVRPNQNLALIQWEYLLESYRIYGVDVGVMNGQPGLSDMVFIANAGLPLGKHFIISNFFHKERRPEVKHIRSFFSLDNNLWNMFVGDTFEGQGDALLVTDRNILVGCGIRTNKKAVNTLSATMRYIDSSIRVIPLFFRKAEDYGKGERIFYHLDTCLLYLKKIETFLIYPRAFQRGTISLLRCLGDVMEVTKDEAESFVCNSVVVDEDIIFTPKIGPGRIRNFLIGCGYKVLEHDMSEFIKSGGAVKCLSLEMYN